MEQDKQEPLKTPGGTLDSREHGKIMGKSVKLVGQEAGNFRNPQSMYPLT